MLDGDRIEASNLHRTRSPTSAAGRPVAAERLQAQNSAIHVEREAPTLDAGNADRRFKHHDLTWVLSSEAGTEIVEGRTTAYCPYCRKSTEPQEFATKEQIRYAKDMAMTEAHEGLDRMVRDALKRAEQLERAFTMVEADARVRQLREFLERLDQGVDAFRPPFDERVRVWIEVLRDELANRNPVDEIIYKCFSVPSWSTWPPAWWPPDRVAGATCDIDDS